MAEENYIRRIGDRKEGRKIRNLPTLQKLIPYFTKSREEAAVIYEDCVEITELEQFIRKKRSEDCPELSIFHVLVAAYVRTVALRPGLNRFVSGQRIYARNKINVITTGRRAAASDEGDIIYKLEFAGSDTVSDIYRRINEKLARVRTGDVMPGIEVVVSPLTHIPGPIAKLAVWFLGIMDYMDWLPASFLDMSPFHGSMEIFDFASLGIRPAEISLSQFGNIPLKISFGAKRKVVELEGKETGAKAVVKQYVDYKILLDGRICDRNYYSSAFKYFKHFLKHPELLDVPETAQDDIF